VTRIALALVWLLRFLPYPALSALGRLFGILLYHAAGNRRSVALTNVRLCFPRLAPAEVDAIVRAHFRALGRSFLDRGILWWGSKARLHQLVRIEGEEHWHAVADRAAILLAPHFVGLDMGGLRFSTEHPAASMYSRQKDPVIDRLLYRGRTRFGAVRLYARQEGLRPVLRALREGMPFYYLPDMDLGARDAVFVPFFGVQAATITALARIAAISGAAVVPCVTRYGPGNSGYVMRFYPPWDAFPSDDLVADTRRMNAFIEDRVRETPEQYYWVHKRFKTRPAGEKSPYDE
jgi:KDO2-lipid IV(A) lauroyltransferase